MLLFLFKISRAENKMNDSGKKKKKGENVITNPNRLANNSIHKLFIKTKKPEKENEKTKKKKKRNDEDEGGSDDDGGSDGF